MSKVPVFVANHGRKPEKEVTVNPDFSDGDYTVTPDEGTVITKATVKKPDTLISSNILSGVEIAGVVGSVAEPPTLHAVTISLSGTNLSITNPSTNGDFVTGYKLYNGDTYLFSITSTVINLTAYDFSAGDYELAVCASGDKFMDSEKSNAVSITAYSVEGVLDGVTLSGSDVVFAGQTCTVTLVADDYKFLPNEITVTEGGTEITDYTYNSTTGVISVTNVTGNLVITATGTDMPQLDTPSITLSDDYTLSVTPDSNSESFVIYADDTEYLEVTI